MTSTEQAALAGAYSASFTMVLLIALACWVLMIIARWRIFTKAGEAGWKSIIPVYGDYVQWRIGWKKTGMFWAVIALVVVGIILIVASGAVATNAAGKLVSTGGGNFITIIGLVCILAAWIIELIAVYKLFASFGKGVGWFILFIFFSYIVLMVLSFGSSEYQGAQD